MEASAAGEAEDFLGNFAAFALHLYECFFQRVAVDDDQRLRAGTGLAAYSRADAAVFRVAVIVTPVLKRVSKKTIQRLNLIDALIQ